MRVHIFQHVPFEGLGSIESWLDSHRCSISTTRFFAGDPLPDAGEIDFLIVLGGPMSANDETSCPWLIEEKNLVGTMVQANKPVLGICLGAQIIAAALGARVFRNSEKEIGWFPVNPPEVNTDRPDLFQFSKETLAFHWHGETFDLPEGAVHLAASSACKHQAFQIGSNVLGLQFHLEMTPESSASLITHCKDEILPGRFIQSEKDMLSVPAERYLAANLIMDNVLSFLTRQP
jgi:GMP synthase-like glutamine amidotransferase